MNGLALLLELAGALVGLAALVCWGLALASRTDTGRPRTEAPGRPVSLPNRAAS